MKQQDKKRLVFVIFPGITLLDLVGPLQAFTDAGAMETNCAGYDITVASHDGGRICSDTCLEQDTIALSGIDPTLVHTMIVAGGSGVHEASEHIDFVSEIKSWTSTVERIASVCSGAFLLAAAGVLDGKRVATHWSRCAQLQSEYPNVRVERDPIYVRDGNVWTSAGITAGIDLALAMIADDYGRPLAMEVARNLVAYMVRPGGQSQFSNILAEQCNGTESRFSSLHEWVSENLAEDLRVDVLANHMNMSPRNFARAYAIETGQTPAKMVEGHRVHSACSHLENTETVIPEISALCGFGNEERMRRSFLRVVGVPPSEYRARFRHDRLTA